LFQFFLTSIQFFTNFEICKVLKVFKKIRKT
jgi:hypothetical protein